MPAERQSLYPDITSEEWAVIKESTSPEIIAARSIAVAKFGRSIPARGFLIGENDHSGVMRGLIEYTTRVRALLDAMENTFGECNSMPAAWEDNAGAIYEMMEGPDGLR